MKLRQLLLPTLLLAIPSALATPVQTFLATGSGIIEGIQSQPKFVSFALLFLAFVAILKGGAKFLDHEDKHGRASTVLAVVLGAALAYSLEFVVFSENSFIEFIGPIAALVILGVAIVVGIGIFYKKTGGKTKFLYPAVAGGILLLHYLVLASLFDNYPAMLGGGEAFIDIIVVVCWAILLVVLGRYALDGINHARVGRPLTDDELEDSKKAIKQRGEIYGAKQELRTARRKAKDKRMKEDMAAIHIHKEEVDKCIANVYGIISRSDSKGDRGRSRFPFLKGELEKISLHSGKIGAYVGMVYHLVNEIEEDPALAGNRDLKSLKRIAEKLEAFDHSLEEGVKGLSTTMNQLRKDPSEAHWDSLGTYLKETERIINKIHSRMLVALKIEERIQAKAAAATP